MTERESDHCDPDRALATYESCLDVLSPVITQPNRGAIGPVDVPARAFRRILLIHVKTLEHAFGHGRVLLPVSSSRTCGTWATKWGIP